MRFIMSEHNRYHISYKDFQSLNYLDVNSRVQYLTLCQMYKILNKKGPKYLQCILTHSTHQHNTRNRELGLTIPRMNSFGKKSFSYIGPVLWNKLSEATRKAENVARFKKTVKNELLMNMKNYEQCDFIY